jgi:phosphoglycolate phosphatase/pyrophosphatase PpaX
MKSGNKNNNLSKNIVFTVYIILSQDFDFYISYIYFSVVVLYYLLCYNQNNINKNRKYYKNTLRIIMLKYKCLVLDHDDTVVKSTPQIHYPCFVEILSKLRPGVKLSLEQFYMYCFDPGFYPMCTEIFKFNKEEMQYQLDTWLGYVRKIIPDFYEGMSDIIKKQKDEGGYICVVSHSMAENIIRDYTKNCGILPDSIYGWEQGENKRKPCPYPLYKIMETYDLTPQDLLMVDDLKPGFDMSRCCNVEFAYAGWSVQLPAIREFMKKYCNNNFYTTKDLYNYFG